MELKPEDWLRAHGDALFRYALVRTGRRDVAEDLVQDTLLAAWRGRGGFRAASGERTWLFGIMKHKIDDHFRSVARCAGVQPPPGDETALDEEGLQFDENGSWRTRPGAWGGDPLGQVEVEQFWQELHRCVEALPERLREGFILRELSELESRQICEVLEVSENNLYVMLHRARLRLRACLEHAWFGSVVDA